MGRIAAIGGGEIETTHRINQFIAELTGKEKNTVLFVGTASHDAENYISAIHSEFESLGCVVNELNLTTEKYTDDEIDSMLNQADVIYVGGGDTAFMMEVWRQYKLDLKLREIYLSDRAVLSGISAGAMCWFNCGHSDSPVFRKDERTAGYGWINGLLDIYPYAFCPHYNERSESFDEMIREKRLPGIALEENIAFVEKNGHISFVASACPAKAYVIKSDGDKFEKQEQTVITL